MTTTPTMTMMTQIARLSTALPRAKWRCEKCVKIELQRHRPIHMRQFHIGNFLMPPTIFTGLFLALWTYKCIMLVLFQNVIIYNPFLPPNARSMQISDYARQCWGTTWREERIRSLDGTEIALCVGEISSTSTGKRRSSITGTQAYILYFQGNASSLPPRLPDISGVFRRLDDLGEDVHYTMICVSYRGYWTSHDRPSEKGINLDTEAALEWVSRFHHAKTTESVLPKPVVVLWGQSIGCGFATNLAAQTQKKKPSNLNIDALVLETPFTNTRAMLYALYPQKWLPYQHLWPFLRNHLDSLANIEIIAKSPQEQRPAVYILEASKDELVPSDHGTILYQRCQDVGLFAEKHSIRGALHNDIMVRKDGKHAIARSISSAVARARLSHSPSVWRRDQKYSQSDDM